MSHGIQNVSHDSFICAHISISYWIGGSSRILPASSQLLVDSCAVTHSFIYGCHGWIPPIRELIHMCVTWLVHIRFKSQHTWERTFWSSWEIAVRGKFADSCAEWFTSDSKKKLRKDTAAHFECAHIWMSHGILIHMCVTWLVHIRFQKEAAERHGCSLRFKKKQMWTSHVTHIRMSQGIHFSRISEQWWRRRENTTTRVDKKNKCGSAMTPIHKWMSLSTRVNEQLWRCRKNTTTHVDQKINVHQSWHPYMHKWARYSICLSQRAMMKTQRRMPLLTLSRPLDFENRRLWHS